MSNYLKATPLSDQVLAGGRESLMKWLYGMYRVVTNIESGEKQTFETIRKTMELMRKS